MPVAHAAPSADSAVPPSDLDPSPEERGEVVEDDSVPVALELPVGAQLAALQLPDFALVRGVEQSRLDHAGRRHLRVHAV